MTAAPRTVSKFEGRLITLARAIVRLTPADPAAPFLSDKLPPPAGLSASCLELVCSALANGCVQYLAKAGWRRERFLQNGAPVEGRLWERHPLDERKLSFSRHALDFLIALAAGSKLWQPPTEALTPGDELVILLAFDAFREAEAAAKWPSRPAFARNPLCRFVWPHAFAGQGHQPPDFTGWGAGLRASILEALQPMLAERWRSLPRAGDSTLLSDQAAAIDLVIDRLLPAIDPQRRDLAGFLIQAAAGYCGPGVRLSELAAGWRAPAGTRLAEWHALQMRLLVLPRALERLSAWERQSRGVGYLDDGYTAAQFFLGLWEAADAGPALARARALLRATEPLAMPAKEANHEPGLSSPSERE